MLSRKPNTQKKRADGLTVFNAFLFTVGISKDDVDSIITSNDVNKNIYSLLRYFAMYIYERRSDVIGRMNNGKRDYYATESALSIFSNVQNHLLDLIQTRVTINQSSLKKSAATSKNAVNSAN
jgi:hypothetical protein